MRRFLNGYYPLRLSLRIDYSADRAGAGNFAGGAGADSALREGRAACGSDVLFEGPAANRVPVRRD